MSYQKAYIRGYNYVDGLNDATTYDPTPEPYEFQNGDPFEFQDGEQFEFN